MLRSRAIVLGKLDIILSVLLVFLRWGRAVLPKFPYCLATESTRFCSLVKFMICSCLFRQKQRLSHLRAEDLGVPDLGHLQDASA